MIILTSFGDAMVMKANIGVNAYEIVSMTLNYATGIKVGTAGLIINIICMVIFIILKRKINITTLLQTPMCLLLGFTVNFVYYTVFGSFDLTYPLRLILNISGLVISASWCGLIMNLDVVAYPYESLCAVISDKCHFEFSKVHMFFDCMAVVSTFVFLSSFIMILRQEKEVLFLC